MPHTHNPGFGEKNSFGSTHTRELDATVTALGSSALLLDVEVPELAAGGLDDADLVGPRVVPKDKKIPVNNSLSRSKNIPVCFA